MFRIFSDTVYKATRIYVNIRRDSLLSPEPPRAPHFSAISLRYAALVAINWGASVTIFQSASVEDLHEWFLLIPDVAQTNGYPAGCISS